IFEAEGDPNGEAETLDLLGMASTVSGDEMAAAEYYERAAALARILDDRQVLSSTLASSTLRAATFQSTSMVLPEVTLAEATRDGEEAIKFARDIGQRSGEAYALWLTGLCLGAAGEYGQAIELAETGLGVAEEIEHRQWMVGGKYALAELYRDLLDLNQARELLEVGLPAARAIGSGHWTRVSAGTLGSVLIAQGHFDAAEAVLDAAFPPSVPTQTLGQRLVWCAQVELALARNMPALARSLIVELLAATRHASGERIPLRLALLRGQALGALGRADEAEKDLLAAQAIAEAHGARSILWRIWLALGGLYTDEGRTDDAGRAFAVARNLIEQIAATVPDPALRDGFLQRARLLLPAHAAVPRRRTAAARVSGLTSREREVASLVVTGKSNRAIADELVVSERTVESHVTNILGKLGFTSRAQIAAWVVEQGLQAARPDPV
ncbi:MAG TPA: LuxR C-terminal-related transcriptional regulator, partial [Ktedonobacterales bacterium]|nr:LuxR C-terminal-related transcriptional regulator [Ktedonobacterales bacterium]